jgi:hypothetical protein
MKSMWSGRAFAGSLLNFVSGSRLIEVLRNGYKQEGGHKAPFLQTEINLFPSFSFGLLRFGILILSAHRRSQINDRTHDGKSQQECKKQFFHISSSFLSLES